MKNINFFFLIFVSLVILSCSRVDSLSDVETQFVKMEDGTAVAYKQYGKGDAKLVFVHGFGCDMNAWEEQFKYFKDKANMVFVDMPGYGQSDKPQTEYTLDFYSEAVQTVLDQLDMKEVVLIGHSLGTPVCRRLIFNHPGTAAGFVDVDGVYCFYPEDSLQSAENEKLYSTFVSVFEAPDITQIMKEFITPLFAPSTPESVKEYAISTMLPTPQYIANSTMKNMIRKEYWPNVTIDIPTLVFATKNSQIPPDYEQIMKHYYSDMQYIELDSVGHFIMMEEVGRFNEAVEGFVEKMEE